MNRKNDIHGDMIRLCVRLKTCLIATIKSRKEERVTQWRMMKPEASLHVSRHVSRVTSGHVHVSDNTHSGLWMVAISTRKLDTFIRKHFKRLKYITVVPVMDSQLNLMN